MVYTTLITCGLDHAWCVHVYACERMTMHVCAYVFTCVQM